MSVGMHRPYRLSHAPSRASCTILALETLEKIITLSSLGGYEEDAEFVVGKIV